MTAATLMTLKDLQEHVREVLCRQNDLEPAVTPLHHMEFRKDGQISGLFFHVQGPRLVKSYAVWSVDESRILFYDGKGNRFAETLVSEGPELD